MTFTQLEYVIAVDQHRHFAKAAAACFVTQPTLSMQLHKLEKELGIQIFDRSKQPVVPTQAGLELIAHARKVINERNNLTDFLQLHKGIIAGDLRIGVIPTLAPYLLPLFIPAFTKKYSGIKLIITELTTENIIEQLKEGRIDAGILVTPLNDPGIKELVLFYEEMMAYISPKNKAYQKTYILPQDIDPNKLWLLEEGHCFRTQIASLCQLRKASPEGSHFEYEAGSLETLRRLVEMYDGITILPELATKEFTTRQKKLIRHFKKPVPMREVSIVLHRDQAKKRMVDILRKEILKAIPEKIAKNKSSNVIPVEEQV
ncbi:MAG TPA: hydrogen peroxide-inducible genes activator [Chitinophagaceae bacterium]|nr:hydrogen peroxide-inducible genes activator [Chitinophagaceae bacterium]MCB9054269.1 hydrogen peroxide-inducible genes activator [Chitinophagales bacterium]HPG12177.1 hydrogen peroxide-inducible genes activator [Chitinophagaceae bacterium]